MGIDAGFDMISRLSKGAVDRRNWQSFIKTLKERYQNLEMKPNYLIFKANEHPQLRPRATSSYASARKVSGSHAKGVKEYIDLVTLVAEVNFWFPGPTLE